MTHQIIKGPGFAGWDGENQSNRRVMDLVGNGLAQ
jgi:hypothetical protein